MATMDFGVGDRAGGGGSGALGLYMYPVGVNPTTTSSSPPFLKTYVGSVTRARNERPREVKRAAEKVEVVAAVVVVVAVAAGATVAFADVPAEAVVSATAVPDFLGGRPFCFCSTGVELFAVEAGCAASGGGNNNFCCGQKA